MFSCNFYKYFFYRTPQVAASGNTLRSCIFVSNRNSFLVYRVHLCWFPTSCKLQKFSDGLEGHFKDLDVIPILSSMGALF